MPQQQNTAPFPFPAPVSDDASMQELVNYIHQAMAAIEEEQDNPGFVPAGHRVRSASGLMHRSGHGAEHDRRVLFELYTKLQFIELMTHMQVWSVTVVQVRETRASWERDRSASSGLHASSGRRCNV